MMAVFKAAAAGTTTPIAHTCAESLYIYISAYRLTICVKDRPVDYDTTQ